MEFIIITLCLGLSVILGALAYNYYLLPYYKRQKEAVLAREAAEIEYRKQKAEREARYAEQDRELHERKAQAAIKRAEAAKQKQVEAFLGKGGAGGGVQKKSQLRQNLDEALLHQERRFRLEQYEREMRLKQRFHEVPEAKHYNQNSIPENVLRVNEETGQWESVPLEEFLKLINRK